MPASPADLLLVSRIRAGEPEAWEELIARYEGRLLAFGRVRLGDRSAAEDVVQEALLGFLVSLPNYDETTPLESWLFSITAHKLTDHLRREGRRPTVPLAAASDVAPASPEPPGPARRASSLLLSGERRGAEERVIADCLRALVGQWRERGDYERLRCLELLFVTGLPNKTVAERLGISEQAVANHKHFVVGKLKEAAHANRLTDLDLAEFGIT
jgi:RNA polymerase sigma-70 factor (ECF subfamily)